MKPRKHAELIKRWAEDSEAVVQYFNTTRNTWETPPKAPEWIYNVQYRVSLVIVEGMPVFDDSVIFRKDTGLRVRWDATAKEFQDEIGCWKDEFGFELTWTPPKPATVTVELLREDAQNFIDQKFMAEGFARIVNAMYEALK